MITDRETNKLYISDLLKEKHPQFHQHFVQKLQNAGITVNYLKNTKDIWCRDYMPIQKNEHRFIQFKFDPSYLKYRKYNNIRTSPKNVWGDMGISVQESDVILDGGNIVKWNNKAIVTERISKDNLELDEAGVYQTIKRELGVEKLIVIPELKGEMTGHSDGILRFIDENFVVINDFSKVDKSYGQKLKFSLLNAGISYIELPNEFEKTESYIDDRGDYVNFLEMENIVLIPSYKSNMDEVALLVYKELFNGKRVESIDCSDIAINGGALNCITWSIKDSIE